MKSQTPQLEDGFTRIANEILEKLVTINLSSYQTRILLYILRKTYGYGKKEDWISVSQMVKGTEIKKSHVSRTKKELLLRKIVASSGNKISFQKDSRLWCKLPKQVTINKVTSLGQKVTSLGQKLPLQGNTKETIQKIITKDNNTNVLQKVVYGNPDINLLITYMKEKLGLPILDDSEKTNRNYCNLAIKKFGGVDKVKLLIEATVKNQFWSTKITSFKNLYYKGVNIISSSRNLKFRPTEIQV